MEKTGRRGIHQPLLHWRVVPGSHWLELSQENPRRSSGGPHPGAPHRDVASTPQCMQGHTGKSQVCSEIVPFAHEGSFQKVLKDETDKSGT